MIKSENTENLDARKMQNSILVWKLQISAPANNLLNYNNVIRLVYLRGILVQSAFMKWHVV